MKVYIRIVTEEFYNPIFARSVHDSSISDRYIHFESKDFHY